MKIEINEKKFSCVLEIYEHELTEPEMLLLTGLVESLEEDPTSKIAVNGVYVAPDLDKFLPVMNNIAAYDEALRASRVREPSPSNERRMKPRREVPHGVEERTRESQDDTESKPRVRRLGEKKVVESTGPGISGQALHRSRIRGALRRS